MRETEIMKYKVLFWLKRKRVLIPSLAILFYFILFNSFTGQILLDRVMGSVLPSVDWNAKVTRFSLFRGVELESVTLTGRERFQDPPLLVADRLAIRYNLWALFAGRLAVNEVGFKNARVHLWEENGVWNYQEMFPPSDKPQDEKREENKEPLESISTYIPVSVYALVDLQNFGFRMEKRSSPAPMDLGFSDFSLRFLLDTHRFREIPLNLGALELVDRLQWEINQDRTLPFWYKDSKIQFESPINLSFLLLKENQGTALNLRSSLNLGGKELRIRRPGKPPLDFGFAVHYDIQFSPGEDEIALRDFRIRFQEDDWLQISGKVTRPFSDSREMDLFLHGSVIRLAPLSRFLQELPLPGMELGGVLELSPLKIQGSFRDLSLDWEAQARDLVFSKGNVRHSSRFLDLDLSANLDLDSDREPTASDPIPLLKELRLRNFRAEYNGLVANLRGTLNPTSLVDLHLHLDRVNLAEFVRNTSGSLDADLKIQASDMSNLHAVLDGKLGGFRFTMDRGRSGVSQNSLKASLNLEFDKPFGLKNAIVHSFVLLSKNAHSGLALDLNAKTHVSMGDAITVQLNSLNASASLTNLMPILPLSLREKVTPIEASVSKTIQLGVTGFFHLGEKNFRGNLTGKIPGIGVEDLTGQFALKMPPGIQSRIELDKLQVRAFGGSLGLDLSGELYEKPKATDPPLGPFFGNLTCKLFLSSAVEKALFSGIRYQGEMYLTAKILDNDVRGELVSNNSKIGYNNGKCPGKDCKIFLVDNLNADIPIHHDLAFREARTLVDGDKSRFIKSYGRIPDNNLTIHQVLGSHPSIVGAPFAYVRSSGAYPGLVARVQYQENYLWMDGLKLSLLDGSVTGKDVVVNVGSGDPKKMEFMATMQVRDIDLRQLLSRDAQGKIDDGKIKADLNLSGVNLADPIPNLNLYFSIFQIGRDFGKSAMNVISTKGAIMDFITDSYAVDKVEVELSKGLVYADVLFKKSLLTYMVNLEDSKISQQRMPLANFLKRAEGEISTYK